MKKQDLYFKMDKFSSKRDKIKYAFKSKKGLSLKLIQKLSQDKKEPTWMFRKRIQAFKYFLKMPLPKWGPDLSQLDFNEIYYYLKPLSKKPKSWQEIPLNIRRTYEALGLPEAEQKFLAGLVAQYESEAIYEKLRKSLEKQGVIFCSLDEAVLKYPHLVKKYFMRKCVPLSDNKFAALNGAIWSGGSFIYVPPKIKVPFPLHTYFRMNAPYAGQFEHTIIIADKGSSVHYIEGCTAPLYDKISLHSGVVEVFVKEKAQVRYTSIQNWSINVYNLNTKRALVDKEGKIEWISGNLGSGITMLYPCSVLQGPYAKASHLSISLSSKNQIKDVGAKVIHNASFTTSNVISKSVVLKGGTSVYRGLIKVAPYIKGVKSSISCHSLLLDKKAIAQTIPLIENKNKNALISHEAKISQISEKQIFYLMSRGFDEEEAKALIVNGFLENIVKKIPLEYALELNRLVQLKLKKAIG